MSAGGSDIDENSPLQHSAEYTRRLTTVLVKLTTLVVVAVSLAAGLLHFYIDFEKETHHVKRTVQLSAEGFLPALEKAVWELDKGAAESIISGLLNHPAIRKIEIEAGNEIFVMSLERQLEPIVSFLPPDIDIVELQLSQPLDTNQLSAYRQRVGRIVIEVDKSIISPSFVERKITQFLILLLENTIVLGCLVFFVFGDLARYLLQMSSALSKWQPKNNMEDLPAAPRLFRHSEIEHLGFQLKKLMQIASRELKTLRSSHDKINDLNVALKSKSDTLAQALKKQNIELERANQKLFELATRDKLTNAFNRRYFEEEINRLWCRAIDERQHFAILICDIDHFKKYNDFYGHLKGDICLRNISNIMQQVCDEANGLFARYGGEEFIVFIPDGRQSNKLAEDLVSSIASLELDHAQSPVAPYVTLSVGVAENKYVQANDILELIEAADMALYRAKENGRNRHEVATLELLQVATFNSDLEFEIENAINLELFQPFFQPQVDMRTGEIVGLEVLARMPTSNDGLLMPRAFIAKAEALNDINRIDAVIQRHALSILDEWVKQGIAPQNISFNLSENTVLAGQVPKILSEWDELVRGRVSFEIAEKVVLETSSNVFHDRLREIIDRGVSIEIDQFGVGLSSICALADIAPQRIKISHDLISMIGMQPEGRKIVRAVVEIANAFDIEVIAVGVETEYQSKFLSGLGVHHQQGYLIAHPLQREKIESLLKHNRHTDSLNCTKIA